MNGFELRQKNRKLSRASRYRDEQFLKILEAAGVQSFFEDAYIQLHGRKPKLVYKAGWFHLQGKRVSRAKLQQQAMILWSQLQQLLENSDGI